LKLEYDDPLSNFAFNFNLRRYSVGVEIDAPCLDECRSRAASLGPDVASLCSWHLRDITSLPAGSLGRAVQVNPRLTALGFSASS